MKVREEAAIHNDPGDLDYFLLEFTREHIFAEIERTGIFTLEYRILMDGRPMHVQMKAAMVEEKDRG